MDLGCLAQQLLLVGFAESSLGHTISSPTTEMGWIPGSAWCWQGLVTAGSCMVSKLDSRNLGHAVDPVVQRTGMLEKNRALLWFKGEAREFLFFRWNPGKGEYHQKRGAEIILLHYYPGFLARILPLMAEHYIPSYSSFQSPANISREWTVSRTFNCNQRCILISLYATHFHHDPLSNHWVSLDSILWLLRFFWVTKCLM